MILQAAKKTILQTLVMGIILAVTLSPALARREEQRAIVESMEGAVDAGSNPYYDIYGNVVRDELNRRFNYLILDNQFIRVQLSDDNTPLATQRLPFDPFDGPKTSSMLPLVTTVPTQSTQDVPEYLNQKWQTSIWGTGIGASGITILDIDDDGIQEIVAGGGYGFGGNRFWYVLSYSTTTGNYQQEWVSLEYPDTITRIAVADIAENGQYGIYVALSNGEVQVYDAKTREQIGAFSSPFSDLWDIVIADVDNDDEYEIVTSSTNGIAVHHAETYAVEWQTTSYGSNDVEVGNVDDDGALEIVTTEHVIDGISHTLEWNYPDAFGAIVQLADVDNDERAEIIAAETWYYITAFDVDLQSPKWDIRTALDIDALLVADFDEDGVQEVVYGDAQWGAIHVIDSATLKQEWSINNPESGVTNVGFGDVDHDGATEVLWGAGWDSTGADYLYVGNTATHSIEWHSQDVGGPLTALDVGDVDNDGTQEIVMVSFESESGYDDGIIFIYDAETYELEWQSAPILDGRAWTGVDGLELADVDEDNVLEIIVATADLYDGVILTYDGITHNLDWQTAKYDGASFSAISVADIDDDDHLEVIAGQDREHTGAEGVYVRVFDGRTGTQEWRTTNLTDWGGVYEIDTGDIDGDGHPEILFSVDGGDAYIYDGITHVREWQGSFVGPRSVAVMDVDQDDEVEFLVGTSEGQLCAFDGQTETQEWCASLSSQSINSLRLVDLHRDSSPEIVLSDSNSVSVYDAATRRLMSRSQNLGTVVGNGGHLIVEDIDRDARDEFVFGSSFAMYVLDWSTRPVSVTIPVSGGILSSPFDDVTYIFPADTFTDTMTVTHIPRLESNFPPFGDMVGIGRSYQVVGVRSGTTLQLDRLVTNRPYTVTVQYMDADTGPAIENTLALYYWDGGQWVREPTSVVFADANTVQAGPNHLSWWVVLGETQRVFLPLILR